MDDLPFPPTENFLNIFPNPDGWSTTRMTFGMQLRQRWQMLFSNSMSPLLPLALRINAKQFSHGISERASHVHEPLCGKTAVPQVVAKSSHHILPKYDTLLD
jgi:hypothetical protein